MKRPLRLPSPTTAQIWGVLLLAGALAASSVYAQQGDRGRIRTTEIDGVAWKYLIQGDHVVITSGDRDVPAIPAGTAGAVAVPGKIAGLPVRRIARFAFAGCARLEEAILPQAVDRLLELGPGLFSGCRSLRRVVFPARFRPVAFPPAGTDADFLHGCAALEEVVFPGDVPEKEFLQRLGVSLDGRLRFTEAHAPQWEAYAKDNGINGWKLCDPVEGGDFRARSLSPDDIPVDLSLATYSPEGPPLASVKELSDGFAAFLKSVDADFAQARKSLLAQRQEALMKNKAKVQAAGDIDAVIAFEEALKSDSPVKTEVQPLKEVYAQATAAEAKLLLRSDERRAKAAATMAERLAAIKVKETKAGNVEAAKDIKAYEEQIKALSESLRKRMAACEAASEAERTKPEAAPPAGPMTGRLVVPGATAVSVQVSADEEKGALIGGGVFEKGDLLIVQYTGGVPFSRGGGDGKGFNPDRREGRFHNHPDRSLLRISGPDKARDEQSWPVPAGTEQTPFVFEVPASGRYRLVCFLGNRAQGRASFQVLRVTKFNVQKFRESPLAKQCQW